MYLHLNKVNFILTRLFVLLVIYSLCRITFYLYNQPLFPDVDFAGFKIILLGGMRFDLTAILYLNLLYFLMISLPLSRKVEGSKQYFVISSVVFLLINIVGIAGNLMDTVYYQFTLQRTTFAVLDIFQHEQNITSIITTAMFDFWPVTLVFIFLVSLLSIVTLYTRLKTSSLTRPKYLIGHSVLTVSVLLLSVLGMRSGLGYHTRPIAMNNAGEYVQKANQMALVLNTPFTFLRTINKTSFERLSYFEQEQLEQIFTPIGRSNVDVTLSSKPSNVVILILESFSAEMSGFLNPQLEKGSYRGLTPFLDSLLQQGLTFEYGIAHGRKSIDAIPAVVSGIPSMKVPFVISHYGTNELQGIGNILSDKGYHTSFFHGAPNGSMGFNAIMKLSGFEHYFGMTEFYQADYFDYDAFDGTWGIWDEEFLQYMAKTQSTLPTPFISTFFSLSSHHPFEVPDRYEEQFVADTNRKQTFMYADHALKKYFDTAKQQPWYQDTLFVITADHSSLASYDEYRTDLGKFRIPILFYKPDGSLKQFVDGVAQQADIFPTILDLIGIESTYFSFGQSLVNPVNSRYAISYINDNYQLVVDDYLLQFDGKSTSAFYQYEVDPLLKTNLVTSDDKEVIEQKMKMEQFLKALIQQYNNRMIDNKLTP